MELKMNKLILIGVVIAMVTTVASTQEKMTAFDILDRIDKNMVFTTSNSDVDMIITIKNRVITKSMKSYAVGNDKSFIEFLSPARDKGTKILKIKNIVKIYYPSAERVMRLSGHMLRRSMMGSDFSYEDMTERSKKMKEEYSGEIKADETLNGRPCFVLLLTSKLKKQTYFTRKIWVDKERFIGLKEELYAKSGKFLKELVVNEVKSLNDRFYPTNITMIDKLRKNSKTQMVVKKIVFNIDIPEETFSERQLMKK
jgi:outer membrane lipoprotein-sorting protein